MEPNREIYRKANGQARELDKLLLFNKIQLSFWVNLYPFTDDTKTRHVKGPVIDVIPNPDNGYPSVCFEYLEYDEIRIREARAIDTALSQPVNTFSDASNRVANETANVHLGVDLGVILTGMYIDETVKIPVKDVFPVTSRLLIPRIVG